MKIVSLKIIGLALVVMAGFKADGYVLYDTYPNYNGSSFILTNGQEVGNEVIFGNTFTLTSFSFQFYTTNTSFSGAVGFDLLFYANDGPTNANGYATPGTLIYSNSFMPSASGGFSEITYDVSDFGGALLMPSNFTFTIQFYGLDSSDVIQIPLAVSTNMYGESFGDYWLNGTGGWDLLTNTVSAAFLVSMSGEVTPIPEPSVFYLGTAGGVLLLGILIRKRKSHHQGGVAVRQNRFKPEVVPPKLV